MLYSDVCASSPFQEEPDMTLQVALVGKDGFVIASDRKANKGGRRPDNTFTFRTSDDTEKILAGSNPIVCAYSGNQAARVFARELRKPENVDAITKGQDPQEICNIIFDNLDQILQEKLNSGGQVICAVTSLNRVWEVVFIGRPDVSGVNLCSVGGDRSNAALYFTERYKQSALRSVDDLVFLAAHTILEGAFLNPTEIGGLDVFVSKIGRLLNEPELELLCLRSKALHEQVSKELYRV